MIVYRQNIEKEIDGKKISFKFDMASIEALGDMQSIGLADIIRSASVARLSTLSAFLYCGAVRHCQVNKQAIDFMRDDAGEWVNTLGTEEVLEMITKCFSAPKDESKKEKATATENGVLETH